MGEWHLSKYTMFTKPSNHNFMVAVNLMKGTQTILFPEELPQLINFKRLDENSDLFKKFKKQGLIINYNELSMIDSMAKCNCASGGVIMTICPTLNCNFNCPYCFEKHLPGKMSEEIQDKIVQLTEKMLKIVKRKTLSVTWYGGEPLLAPEIIENLSNKLIELCKKEDVIYSAGIITNGYLLNQDIVDMLNKVKVFSYQITLDGIDVTHNKTRKLVNGEGTFERIGENLRTLKIKGNINIRHNVHKDNANEINMLRNFVKSLAKQSGNKIGYYPAFVFDNAAEKREGQVDFLDEEEKIELESKKDFNLFSSGKAQYCGSQLLYTCVIDPKGNLYKCWEDVDKSERSFGHVNSWNPNNPLMTATNPDILTTYFNLTGSSLDEECVNCIWLPLCRGGCPSKRLYSKKVCVSYKNEPEVFLSKIIKDNIKKWEVRHNIKNE